MGFSLKGLFKKKKQEEKFRLGDLTTVFTPYQIDFLMKEVKVKVVEYYSNKEIARLQKIQNRTKKWRTKKKLQKRIDKIKAKL